MFIIGMSAFLKIKKQNPSSVCGVTAPGTEAGKMMPLWVGSGRSGLSLPQ